MTTPPPSSPHPLIQAREVLKYYSNPHNYLANPYIEGSVYEKNSVFQDTGRRARRTLKALSTLNLDAIVGVLEAATSVDEAFSGFTAIDPDGLLSKPIQALREALAKMREGEKK